jgi:nucleoside triphosphate diphosphatase
MQPDPVPPLEEFSSLLTIVRRLRRECPWDREQTHQSLRESFLEESYEVIEALDAGNIQELKQELGDALFHILIQAVIAEEVGEFTLADIITGIQDKLVRRHPHVFGEATVDSSETVRKNWEQLKMREGRSSVLEGVPPSLPALQRALRVQERAARVGFDWSDSADVVRKVFEESGELQEALTGGKDGEAEAELGDLFFALVNYARHLKMNPETSLRLTVEKFTRRFQFIEDRFRSEGKDIAQASLTDMDAVWNEAKKEGL